MFNLKTLLVERPTNCPRCDHHFNKGGVMYFDEYRNETICPYCLDEYKEDVISEEGENGELLK